MRAAKVTVRWAPVNCNSKRSGRKTDTENMVAQGKNTGYNNYEYKCEKKEKKK